MFRNPSSLDELYDVVLRFAVSRQGHYPQTQNRKNGKPLTDVITSISINDYLRTVNILCG